MDLENLYQVYLSSNGVSIDSRSIEPGQIFFAISGPNFDGNQYAGKALENGALLAVVSDEGRKDEPNYWYSTDSVKLLQDLARYHRSKLEIPVFGITGSNGKTTTKELLGAVLSQKFVLGITQGNYNNHLGVPITILNQSREAEFLVVEMGSNQPGDIEFLCTISKPDYGLITNIGISHIEGLSSKKGILNEKKALYDFIAEHGAHYFLNIGDPMLSEVIEVNEHVEPYSMKGGSFGDLDIAESSSPNLSLNLHCDQGTYKIDTALAGQYNMENIAAAISVGRYFDISYGDIVAAIQSYRPDNMRSQIIETERNTVIMDAYNANPSSMKLSIESVDSLYGKDKIFIIGDMLELGEQAESFHRDILSLLQPYSANCFLVGPIWESLQNQDFKTFNSVDDLKESGLLLDIKNNIILVKASRGIGLERVLDQL